MSINIKKFLLESTVTISNLALYRYRTVSEQNWLKAFLIDLQKLKPLVKTQDQFLLNKNKVN